MNRFFLNQENFLKGEVLFPRAITHQILHVLRLGDGDEVYALDNQGQGYQVRLVVDQAGNSLRGEILSSEAVTTEPDTQVSLCFGLTNRDKVELILQKGTEVGVSAFYPFISERTLIQTTDLSAAKFERWERIIREAAEQSGRGRLPQLHRPTAMDDCARKVSGSHARVLAAWEEAGSGLANRLSTVLAAKTESLALFVGPEGGFSSDEIQSIQNLGGEVVSLGKRILRMETAAIVFPALVLFGMGE